MAKSFKVAESILKTVRAGYLYSNGKLVLVHEESHPKAGTVEWVTIHDTTIGCEFHGRIVLHRRGVVRLTLQALRVHATETSVENGSENTRKRNLAIGHVSLTLGPSAYTDAVYIPIVDGLSGDWTYQPDQAWVERSEPSGMWWAGYRVDEVRS
jgi:hypothetical protein